MYNTFTKYLLIFSLFFYGTFSYATDIKDGYSISGFIKDRSSGEILPGATVFVNGLQRGTAANAYGFYSITLPEGEYKVRYSFIGFSDMTLNVRLSADTTINVELFPTAESLKEVEITGQAVNENITSSQMSVTTLSSQTIKEIPAFLGEVDLIKALQLLPGVKFVAEGSSGFSVRGSSPDQNLVILDEATVYNAGHLLGFFSVFNNDAVKSVDLYKGDIPAAYGGRIASLVDVRMKEGNVKQFQGTGGIGLISSRLTLEGPIVKDKASFLVAGRRTYADLFLAFSNDEDLRGNSLYFYDINAKVNWSINQKNRIYLSGYFGKDVFKGGSQFGLDWGNATGTARWNHLFSEKVFANFTFIASRFSYNLGIPEGNQQAFLWESRITDYTLRGDFSWFLNPNNSITFGFQSTYHDFYPGQLEGLGDSAVFGKLIIPDKYSLESAIYISNDQKLGNRVTLKYGIRLPMFNNMGPDTTYLYSPEGVILDSTIHGNGFYNTYAGLEPRLAIVYQLNEVSSIKASYSRNYQFVQQASNSTAGSPFNIWFTSSTNVKPQVGDQIAAGYFRNFLDGMLETSAEVYYKIINDAVDFKDHADLLLNKHLEAEILTGSGRSYGLELMVRKNRGKVTGWISYTWSRSFNQIPGINNGDPYPAQYDRPNDFSIVVNYKVTPTISLGASWVYLTGQPVTFPVGRYEYMNNIVPVYSERNSYRFPDYHRLDLSFTWTEKEKQRRWRNEVNFSIYNAYNRKNPWVINFLNDPEQANTTYAEMVYLFGIIPSVTYNFKF